MIYAVKNFLARNLAQLRYERFFLYLIEEASFMLRHPLGRKYLEQTSRGVRKQGIAQVTISQHPSDFLEDGKIIVANAGTCFFLGMEMSAIEKLKLTQQLSRGNWYAVSATSTRTSGCWPAPRNISSSRLTTSSR